MEDSFKSLYQEVLEMLTALLDFSIAMNFHFLSNILLCFPQFHDHIITQSHTDWSQIYKSVTGDEFPKYEFLKKNTLKDSRGVFYECCYIMLYAKLRSPEFNIPYEEFLLKFPEFSSLDDKELGALKRFFDAMIVAQKCIRPQGNKQRLLEICTHLAEGSTKKYITGCGQTAATARRVLIFHTVAGDSYRSRRSPAPRAQGTANSNMKRKRNVLDEEFSLIDTSFLDQVIGSGSSPPTHSQQIIIANIESAAIPVGDNTDNNTNNNEQLSTTITENNYVGLDVLVHALKMHDPDLT